MGKMQRNKGAAGEREVAKILNEELGIELVRNLEQTRNGGHDLIGLDGWAIEIKRQEQLSINTWWKQTVDQAERIGEKPALFYRQSRKPWMVIVDISDVNSNNFPVKNRHSIQMDVQCFCQLVREDM
ncbi:MAG: hypothetical protein KZQ83_12940 [gamma proteobacterium symbiont of Taylorina sp.]|nr:hypothetical protein [gamma proteobacterium symbiont of Taylorina sp.]